MSQVYTEVVTKLGHERQQNERIKPEVEKYEQRQRILDDVGKTQLTSRSAVLKDSFPVPSGRVLGGRDSIC